MSVTCAFRSDHKTVLDWKSGADSARMSWRSTMGHFDEQWPNHALHGRASAFGFGRHIVGLDGQDSPGEGWRFSKKLGLWVPDKRTKLGKGYAEDLKALQLVIDPLPGMPMTAMEGNRWHHPGVEQIDGIVWVTWGCPAETVRKAEWSSISVDDSLWDESPLSMYYLAKEAA